MFTTHVAADNLFSSLCFSSFFAFHLMYHFLGFSRQNAVCRCREIVIWRHGTISFPVFCIEPFPFFLMNFFSSAFSLFGYGLIYDLLARPLVCCCFPIFTDGYLDWSTWDMHEARGLRLVSHHRWGNVKQCWRSDVILYFAIPNNEDEWLAGSSERQTIGIGDLVLGGCHVHALCRLVVQGLQVGLIFETWALRQTAYKCYYLWKTLLRLRLRDLACTYSCTPWMALVLVIRHRKNSLL